MKLTSTSGSEISLGARDIVSIIAITRIITKDQQTHDVTEDAAEVVDRMHRSIVGLD